MVRNLCAHQNHLKFLKGRFLGPAPKYSNLEVPRRSPGICIYRALPLPLSYETLRGALNSAFEGYLLARLGDCSGPSVEAKSRTGPGTVWAHPPTSCVTLSQRLLLSGPYLPPLQNKGAKRTRLVGCREAGTRRELSDIVS